MEKQKLLCQFNKNAMELVKINLCEYRSDLYFDVRIWVTNGLASPGEESPTKKGLRLHLELLPELIKALQKAQESVG